MLASSSFGARHTAETPRLVLEFADFWFFHPQCFASGALEGRSEHVAGGAPHPARRLRHRSSDQKHSPPTRLDPQKENDAPDVRIRSRRIPPRHLGKIVPKDGAGGTRYHRVAQ